jgi:hypothetical protein
VIVENEIFSIVKTKVSKNSNLNAGLPVLLSLKLPSSITLDVFQNQYELQDFKPTKKGSGWTAVLKRQSSLNLFLSTVITDK